jgi:orotate phosphoribosyltransferase
MRSERRSTGDADVAAALEFVELMVQHGVLKFGQFTLKSGRESPYFFNVGAIDDGAGLNVLGAAYARAILLDDLVPDVIFGPAYKGIPIAVATAMALERDTGRNIAIAFDRKEAKSHGEGGTLIGRALRGRVLIVDDVITDGKAKKEAAALIRANGGDLMGVLVALDRRERTDSGRTAVEQTALDLGVTVKSIASLEDVIAYLDTCPGHTDALGRIRAYRATHCL